MTTATIGERGQITIPKQFRTKLGLFPSMVLTFHISGNTLVAEKQEPSNPFEDARGCLKHLFPKGMRTDDLIREMRGC